MRILGDAFNSMRNLGIIMRKMGLNIERTSVYLS